MHWCSYATAQDITIYSVLDPMLFVGKRKEEEGGGAIKIQIKWFSC